jgi:integrase/recombinase XerC
VSSLKNLEILQLFFEWLTEQMGRDFDPVEVTVFDVQRYRDHLLTLKRKPATINRKLASLRVFFDWAVEQGRASTNPVGDVNGVTQDRRTPKALSSQEIYRLQREAAARRQLAEARAGDSRAPTVIYAYRDEALLNLLLYTGLRVSEAVALRVGDVEIRERSGKVIVRSGKGRKYREVPLNKQARRPLAAYLEVRPEVEENWLFLGQRGSWGARGMQLAIAGLGEVAEVEVTPHKLRHTFATRLLRDVETDLVTVATLMGHASVATTTIYTQPNEADLAKAVEGLE